AAGNRPPPEDVSVELAQRPESAVARDVDVPISDQGVRIDVGAERRRPDRVAGACVSRFDLTVVRDREYRAAVVGEPGPMTVAADVVGTPEDAPGAEIEAVQLG